MAMYRTASPQAGLHWWTESTASSIAAPIASFGLDSPPDAILDLANPHSLECEDYLISDFLDLPSDEIDVPKHSNDVRQYPSANAGLLSSVKTFEATTFPVAGSTSTTDQQTQAGVPTAPKCEDGDDFDWISSLHDDALIYGASNFEVSESFLFASSPLLGCETTNQAGLGCSSDGGKHESNPNVCATIEIKAYDVSSMAPAFRAKSKRPRTGPRTHAGRPARAVNWSSVACFLAPWKESSPTNSMDSTSSEVHQNHTISGNQAADSSPSNYNTSFSSHSTVVDDEDSDVPQQQISSSMTSIEDGKGGCDDQCPAQNIGDSSLTMKWTKGVKPVEGGEGEAIRRCTHCLSTKTPQWRAGPTGPKTLCNACGVRFKSGRLFDEYRPAKSPTFLSYKHSNSHKKVLEMRHRKGVHLRNSPSCSNSSVTKSIRQPSQNGSKKLKIKLERTRIDPHLPEVALINPPTFDSPNFII